MTTFALLLPMILLAGGGATDLSAISARRTQLQSAADAAALAAAKEFRLSNATGDMIAQVAKRFAGGSLTDGTSNAEIVASADMVNRTVTVSISEQVPTYLMHLASKEYPRIQTKATAKVVGGSPICVIGLDSNANSTVAMDKNAKLEAPGCSIYSNSTKPNGLIAKNNAVARAAFICSAGGKSSPGPGSFSPQPQIDCPVLPDPLASRPAPTPAGCMMNNAVIQANMMLNPGTYCGGMTIKNNAVVDLQPGIYIFKDGPLVVTGNGTLRGNHVSLYLTGANATLSFKADSNIMLTAPRDGVMAGMLVFEDRNAAPTTHEILSDNAGTLLGTIYMPKSRFHVAANKPVAQNSAYTIVVANMFTLSEGPTMVLNTNYTATDIPVPNGVGPGGSAPRLIE